MKQSIHGGAAVRHKIPTKEEVEVLEILLTLPKLFEKSELLNRYSFNWGLKKKRSVLISKSESSPLPLTLTHRKIDEGLPEKVTAGELEADKSPTTPLCFLPSESDGGDVCKQSPLLTVKKSFKKKATNDLIEKFNGMQQEREILVRKINDMKNLHQELTSQNLELKAKRQKINYSRNIEDFQLWNNSMKLNFDHYNQQIQQFKQIPIFTPPLPPPPPPQQHCQQMMVDPNNGKLVAVSCSSNSNSGGRFGLFNQIDTRVNKMHGEKTYDFMASSQPLDQNKYLLMDNDLRVRTAAAARKRRILRMKENKNSLLAMKLSRACR